MGLASFSYIDREYLDILSAVVSKVPLLTPEWTDLNMSDIGMTIVQQFSGIAEMLAYTQDQHANQLTIPTCTQRESMINLTESLAYDMAGYTAASVDFLFSRTPYTTTSSATTLSSSITAQTTSEFNLTAAAEYETDDVVYLTNSSSQSEYAIVSYKVGSKITIKGVTRYSYSSGDAVLRIDSDRNVTIPDSLKCTTSGSSPINFETDIGEISYIIYGGNSYPDQTVVLAYSSSLKTLTLANIYDYTVGDALYIISSVYANYSTLTITAISDRTVTVSESLPSWIQATDNIGRLVPGVQGQSRNETLTASTGLPSQERELSYSPVIEPSVVVTINEGSGDDIWTAVDSFFSSDSNDKNYTVEMQADDKILIIFGDGVNGKIPVLNSVITVSYVQGGGTGGNIGRETITKIASSVVDDGNNTVALTVNNPNASSGGADKESLNVARVRAPALYASVYRALSPTDFESLSSGYNDPSYGTISNAEVVESQVANAVSVYVWAMDSNGFATTTSSGLKASLRDYLLYRVAEGYLVSIIDGYTTAVNITATVTVATGFVQTTVKNDVNNAINTLFQTENLTPGQDFYLSNLYEAIENVGGVDRVDITIPTRPGVTITSLHIATKATVNLTMVGGS